MALWSLMITYTLFPTLLTPQRINEMMCRCRVAKVRCFMPKAVRLSALVSSLPTSAILPEMNLESLIFDCPVILPEMDIKPFTRR